MTQKRLTDLLLENGMLPVNVDYMVHQWEDAQKTSYHKCNVCQTQDHECRGRIYSFLNYSCWTQRPSGHGSVRVVICQNCFTNGWYFPLHNPSSEHVTLSNIKTQEMKRISVYRDAL